MTNELTTTKYEDAICPKVFDVAGWTLAPFCLGHYILLKKIKSPVVMDNAGGETLSVDTFSLSQEEQTKKLEDFFTAVMICAVDYPLASKALRDDDLLTKVAKNFMDVAMKDMQRPNWNYPREFYVFKQYLKYYFNIPPFRSLSKAASKPSGTDWKQNIFIIFKKLGYTESEILCMPFNKLFLEWTSEGEANAKLHVFNAVELKIQQTPCTVQIGEGKEVVT